MKKPDVAAIILTRDEAIHIERCISSIGNCVSRVYVIDSGSTDATVDIAERLGATVLHRRWINYSSQFNWAISQVYENHDWLLRIDADETISDVLRSEILEKLEFVDDNIDGIVFNRRMRFKSTDIKHGGLFPVEVVRIFRSGRGKCEDRWMDEHIVVDGSVERFNGELVDDNLKSLTWWINKHNSYANREVVDLLDMEFHFLSQNEDLSNSQAKRKREIKTSVYRRLPTGFRAFLYFFYRYVLRLGFLDGQVGAEFHVLQGLWYRYLVDCKYREVKKYWLINDCELSSAILDILDIDVTQGDCN